MWTHSQYLCGRPNLHAGQWHLAKEQENNKQSQLSAKPNNPNVVVAFGFARLLPNSSDFIWTLLHVK